MKVSDIGYELAIRLGDPVPPQTPNASGEVFTEMEKLKYITRAFSKLTRLLNILMRDYQPEFNKMRQYKLIDIPPAIPLSSMPIEPVQKMDEVFVHYTIGSGAVQIKPASYMEPSRYLSNKYEVNDTKSTSFEDGKFKYTIMSVNNSGAELIHLLPLATTANRYKKIEMYYKPDLLVLDWDSQLPITNQYVDLLIDLATIQGMQDIARADKAQLIERSINADWQILGQYGTYMKQTEGVKE